jgi:hypothetical protein
MAIYLKNKALPPLLFPFYANDLPETPHLSHAEHAPSLICFVAIGQKLRELYLRNKVPSPLYLAQTSMDQSVT